MPQKKTAGNGKTTAKKVARKKTATKAAKKKAAKKKAPAARKAAKKKVPAAKKKASAAKKKATGKVAKKRAPAAKKAQKKVLPKTVEEGVAPQAVPEEVLAGRAGQDPVPPPSTAPNPGEGLLQGAERGDLEIVRTLLQQGVPVDVRDPRAATKDCTALMLAAMGGHAPVVAELIRAGADVRATDDPTHELRDAVAFMCMQEDVENGGQVGLRLGRTAGHFGAARGHLEVLRILLQAGADPDAVDHTGKTCLMTACRGSFHELAQLLLQAGASPGARDLRGTDALMLASVAGNVGIVQILLGAGAQVDARDLDQRTPLIMAAAGAHAAVVQVLTAAGADPTAQDSSGFGVTSYAIHATEQVEQPDGLAAIRPVPEERILPVLELLLDAGAGDQPDGTGVRPSQRAEGLGQAIVLKLLQDSAAGVRRSA